MTTLTEPVPTRRWVDGSTGPLPPADDASPRKARHHESASGDDLRDSMRAMQESMDLRDQGHS